MRELLKSATTLSNPNLDYLLIDGSASMLDKWPETQAALETYRAGLTGSHLVVTTFYTEDCDFIVRDEPTAHSTSFYINPIVAEWTSTPLFDAINAMGRRIRERNPARATILICTDGQENCSKYTSLAQAKSILDWLRAKGYQVIFLGCDFNNSNQARALGANADTAIGVQKALLPDAAAVLARKRAAYGLYGTPINFSKDEQQQFGGLLPAPPQGA